MSEPNYAGDAFAADMTDESTRATWTEAGLRSFLARLRVMYGDEFMDRVTSVQRIEAEPRLVTCGECHEREPIVGPATVRGYVTLACGHSAQVGGVL